MNNDVQVEAGAVLVIEEDGGKKELTSPVRNLEVGENVAVYVGSGTVVDELYAGIDYGTAGGIVHVYEDAVMSGVWLQGGAEYHDYGGIYRDGTGPEGGWGGYGGAILATSSTISLDGAEFSENEVYSLSWAPCGGAVETYGGSLSVKNCTFQNNVAGIIEDGDSGAGGALCVIAADTETRITDSVFSGNSAYYGGAVQQNGGTMTIDGAEFTGNTAARGGAVQIHSGGGSARAVIRNTVFSGNSASLWGGAIEVIANSTLTVSGITLKTETDTVQNFGRLIVCGKNVINAEVISTGTVIFDMTESAEGDPLVTALGKFSGGIYELLFRQEKSAGIYTLAADAAGVSGLLTLTVGEEQIGRFLVSGGTVAGNAVFCSGGVQYALVSGKDGSLSVSAAPGTGSDFILFADDTGIVSMGYSDDSGSKKLTLSRNGNTAGFTMLSRAVKTYGLDGSWLCDSGNGTVNGKFSAADAPAKFAAETDGAADIFFARAFRKWDHGYQARNTNTDETVFIAGKNRFDDVFSGAEDANVLMLTDDAAGDVLFLDDVFSAGGENARLAFLDEIRAGGGDDVIDLTSTRYSAELDGLTVRGGNGNDILWGAGCSQILFGDAGNDTVCGGASGDIICGGSGSDRLSGGGDDVFCFGRDWGTDTLTQIDGGTTTLVFEEGMEVAWNDAGDALICGKNSIVFSSVHNHTIKVLIGGEYADYDRLASLGCFRDSHSTVFNESPDGVLAVL